MAFRGGGGVEEDMRACSAVRAGERLEGRRAGREVCGVDRELGSSELVMRDSAAARSEGVGSMSMYGRDSWISFMRGILKWSLE